MKNNITFDTWLYDSENDVEHNITIEVHTYFSGSPATYHDPAEDAELEYSVYLEDGSEYDLNSLSDYDRYYLNERVWDYAERYYTDYYDGDY